MSHWIAAEWSKTPCWCNGCHVCGYNGRAPKPVIVVEVEVEEDVTQPTLFDEPSGLVNCDNSKCPLTSPEIFVM